MSSWDVDICEEIECADDDCILGNPQSGYAYTERALIERRKVSILPSLVPFPHSSQWQRHEAFVDVRRPQSKLDPEILSLCKDGKIREPPFLHYGFVVDRKFLEEFVDEHKLQLGDGLGGPNDRSSRAFYLLDTVKKYLMKQCKFPIRTNYALAKDRNLCVVVLDDTRWLRSTTYGGWSKRIAPVLKLSDAN